jgi:hypothetical protein
MLLALVTSATYAAGDTTSRLDKFLIDPRRFGDVKTIDRNFASAVPNCPKMNGALMKR